MTEEKKTYFPWQDGLPTKPDVDLLLSAYPNLQIGDNISYADIEEILSVEWRTARFKTVTTQWRKRLHEIGLVVECSPGAFFYIASCGQISAATHGTLKTISRRARKQRSKLATVKPEDAIQAATIEHQGRLMQGIERESKKARLNLLPSTKTPELPKIKPPKANSA